MKLKSIYLFMVLYCFVHTYTHAALQESKPIEYRARIIFKNNGSVNGFLCQVTDSTVTIVPKSAFQSLRLETRGLYSKEDLSKITQTISARRIKSIKIQKVYRHWSTIVKGAGIGLLAGALIGLPVKFRSHSEDYSGSILSPTSGFVGGVIGALLGIVIPKHKRVEKFAIKGSKAILQQHRVALEGFVLKE